MLTGHRRETTEESGSVQQDSGIVANTIYVSLMLAMVGLK